jgi:hypothetical protein
MIKCLHNNVVQVHQLGFGLCMPELKLQAVDAEDDLTAKLYKKGYPPSMVLNITRWMME